MPKNQDFNVVILDTAGRLHVDEDYDGGADQASKKQSMWIRRILVVDAMTGQDAVNVARDLQSEGGHRRRDLNKAGW